MILLKVSDLTTGGSAIKVSKQVESPSPTTEASGVVTNVVDGDTFDLGIEDTDPRIIYEYKPPRPLEEIEAEIRELEGEIMEMLREVAG